MKRIWPKGIGGRIALILTVGLALANVIAMVIYRHDRMRTSVDVFALSFAEQVMPLAKTIEALPAAEQTALIKTMNNSPYFQVERVSVLPISESVLWMNSASVDQFVQAQLSERNGRALSVQVLDFRNSRQFQKKNSGLPPQQLKIAVESISSNSSVSWLVFTTAFDLRSLEGHHEGSLLFWIGLLGLLIWGLSIWATRRVTKPIRQFAIALDRFGQDIDAPSLPEQGSLEIRQATQAFNRMQTRLRTLVCDRTLMLAAISHDLRTVLTRLKLRAEFIDNREQQQKAIADLDQMEAMLASTLAFAKDDSAHENITDLDLASILQRVCDDLTDAGYQVSYSGPTRLVYQGRAVGLRRAFSNLIENGAIYGDCAEVTLSKTEQYVRIEICDRGPGIPDELQEKVFTPYFRLEPSRSRETGGTGLGMTVARSVIRRHGGEIELVNRLLQGFCVVVTLPQGTE